MCYIFRDAFLEGDFSGCMSVARAINTLQNLYGRIPNVLAHGRASKAVINALEILSEQNSPKKLHQVSDILCCLRNYCKGLAQNWNHY